MNTGYQQATYALKTGQPGGIALDVDGKPCSETGKKQAIILLKYEDKSNIKYRNYEIEERTFNVGDILGGIPSRRRNTEQCPIKTKGHITVSPDRLQIDINETRTVQVDSSHPWRIINLPSELKITPQGSLTNKITVSITALSQDLNVTLQFLNVVTGDIAEVIVTSLQLPDLPDYPIQTGFWKFGNIPWAISGEIIYHKDWDYPLNSDGWNSATVNQQTVQYVRIGEYEWLRQTPSLMYNGNFTPIANITHAMLDPHQANFSVKQTPEEFMYKNGMWVLGVTDMTTYMNTGNMYVSRKNQTLIDGWRPATVHDWEQVFMQSDSLYWRDILKFLSPRRNNPDDKQTSEWENGDTLTSDITYKLDDRVDGTDSVKLHMIPDGTRQNSNPPGENLWDDYRQGIGIQIETANSGNIVLSSQRNGLIRDFATKFWWTHPRWCRPLTDSELGYMLYLDKANDRVVVKRTSESQPGGLSQVPKGTRLRARIVRWLDQDTMEVKAPLSHIEAEVATTENDKSAGWKGF